MSGQGEHITKKAWRRFVQAALTTLTAADVVLTADVAALEPTTLLLPRETTTNLDDVGHAVNTAATKVQGLVIYNTTTDNPVYAVGNADADIWVDGAGSTAHSPS